MHGKHDCMSTKLSNPVVDALIIIFNTASRIGIRATPLLPAPLGLLRARALPTDHACLLAHVEGGT